MSHSRRVSLNASTIRQLRLTVRMTQAQFAHLMGVDPNTVYRWEAGTRHPVTKKRQKLHRMVQKYLKGGYRVPAQE